MSGHVEGNHAPDRLGARVVSSFLWSYGGMAIGRLSFFVATLVLARILEPSDFGLVAFALAVLAYLNNVATHGIGETLVFRPDARSDRVASTAYWLSVGLAVALVALVWAGAPLVDAFASGDTAVWILRALSLQLLVSAFASTHAYLFRHSLEFRRLFVPEQLGGVVKGVLSVVPALLGAGVWSLVIGQLAGVATSAAAIVRRSTWRPVLRVDREEARPILRVGLGFTAVAILGEAARNLDFLIVGFRLGATDLGYYVIAFRLPELAILAVFEVVWGVLFPYYARVRDAGGEQGAAALGASYLRTVRVCSLAAFPLAGAIGGLALPLVVTLYGDRWEQAAGALGLVAVWAALSAVAGLPGTVFKAIGRPGLLTRCLVVYLVALLPALWLAAGRGITEVAAAHVAVQAAYLLFLAAVVARVTEVRWHDTLVALLPGLVLGAVVGAVALAAAQVLPAAAAVVLGGAAAAAVFAGAVALFFRGELAPLRVALRRS